MDRTEVVFLEEVEVGLGRGQVGEKVGVFVRILGWAKSISDM